MEIVGLFVITSALIIFVLTISGQKKTRQEFPKKIDANHERHFVKQCVQKAQSELVLYWVDTLKLLTYAERKDIEQTGRVVSLTPHEVLIEEPSSKRKLAVKRAGDPTAPRWY